MSENKAIVTRVIVYVLVRCVILVRPSVLCVCVYVCVGEKGRYWVRRSVSVSNIGWM